MSTAAWNAKRRLTPKGHIPDPTQNALGGTGDANVVPAHQLAPIINRFITQWMIDRPNIHGWRSDRGNAYYGPCQWLSDTSGVTVRQISRIKNGYLEYVSLNHADALLQAMNVEERLDDDLDVVRNPRWSMERWQAYMAERGCVD